jgi:acetyl-CoA synthetase
VPEDDFPWPDAASAPDAAIDALRGRLFDAVMAELGKPLKPAFIRFARSLPKTRNAKVMRRLIQAVHLDAPLGDTSSLEDPAALDAIRDAC